MRDPTGRRYSDREFALILRKASELQEEDRENRVGGRGMSLGEIQQIAEEAGIDPAMVARAAALIGEGDIDADAGRLWGSRATVHITSSVEGELGEDEMRRLMEIVRYEIAKSGTVSEVLGSVSWKADGQEAPLEVRITPREGRTTLEILSRTQTYKSTVYALGGVAGFIASVIGLPILGAPGALVFAGVLVNPLLGALAVRPAWNWWAGRWRARLTDLLDLMREEAERRILPARPNPELPKGPP